LAPDARRIRPAFVYDPAREILVYRTLLAGAGLGTATCYGSRLDAANDRYWLFLEKVDGVELYQVGEIAAWQAAAAWLARLHAALRARAIDRADAAHLRRYNRGGYICWMDRAREFLARGTVSKPRNAGRIEWLASRFGRVVDRLLALPTTLVHGEFYASNVLVGQIAANGDGPADASDGTAIRVCPIDWETAAIAPGPIDLAALTAGKWTDEQRHSLAAAYQEAWLTQGGVPVATPDVLECCRLFLAVQWMGWAADWAPPQEHANDWLAEALELAERLDV